MFWNEVKVRVSQTNEPVIKKDTRAVGEAANWNAGVPGYFIVYEVQQKNYAVGLSRINSLLALVFMWIFWQ